MARYILINVQTQRILGKLQDDGNLRPFVDIAEAYEELVKITWNTGRFPDYATESADKLGEAFRDWVLHEVRRVEGN